MATIFKRKKNDRNEPYTIQYRDHLGKRRTAKGFSDRALTEQLAAKLESEVRMRKTGLVDPELENAAANKAISLDAHFELFQANLADNSDDYTELIMSRLGRVRKAGKFEKLGDLTLDRVQATLWSMRKKQKWGPRTYNHYVQAVQTFCNWCVTTQRLIANPLLGLERLNNEVDVRRKRRALAPEEVVRLMAAARANRKRIEAYRGELRARLYLMAYLTGLRRRELASLTPRSFKLDAEPPTVKIEAACSKHRREDILPLHPELVQLLREWLPQLRPAEKLFPNLIRKKTAKMVRRDLQKAGIPYVNEDGVADFHAAGRHTYITELLRNGVSLVEAKELARHTDVNMTMRYTHIGLGDRSKAVANLKVPPAANETPSPEAEKGEGTDPSALQMRCIFCSARSHSETLADADGLEEKNKNPGLSQGYVASCHQEASVDKVEAPGIEPGSRARKRRHLRAYLVDFNGPNPSRSPLGSQPAGRLRG